MLRHLAMAAFVVLVLGIGPVDAGVRGGAFRGTVTNVSDASEIPVTTHFALMGNAFLEDFDGDDYPGTYTEFDLFVISFWSVDYDFAAYEGKGVSLFGLITTYYANQVDGDQDFVGLLFRSGPAQIP